MKSLSEQNVNMKCSFIIDDNHQTQETYSREQFMDLLASKVGNYYNLKDIRNAE